MPIVSEQLRSSLKRFDQNRKQSYNWPKFTSILRIFKASYNSGTKVCGYSSICSVSRDFEEKKAKHKKLL